MAIQNTTENVKNLQKWCLANVRAIMTSIERDS